MKANHVAHFTQAIFLVGGFGANRYIFDQITRSHPNIQVIQPNDAYVLKTGLLSFC